ncbi:hypothetical protein FRC09_006210 [Ceratobasidium sp. 395]|nr:hypothetical protein FRC09_006210 [Ceratobasidium sp. 395]
MLDMNIRYLDVANAKASSQSELIIVVRRNLQVLHTEIWINQCVGLRNERHFILFMSYFVVATFCFVYLGYTEVWKALDFGHTRWSHRTPEMAYIIIYILALALGLAVCVMLLWNVYQIGQGVTTVEGYDYGLYAERAKDRGEYMCMFMGAPECLNPAPIASKTMQPHTALRRLACEDAGKDVVLAGWIQPARAVSKHLTFFTLKDGEGQTQLLVRSPKSDSPGLSHKLEDVPVESVVLVQGKVVARPDSAKRADKSSGDVEVHVNKYTVLNTATKLPFRSDERFELANEQLRATHRYLDLRRDSLTNNIKTRSKVAYITRNYLHDLDFTEVETPILLKSTPEGAREFLVPTRPSSSSSPTTGPLFYALPQSPQQPKQLLVCSGAIDKYYQIARCFRDEDGRKDRQPEFTQIDLEMAFVSWGDVAGVSDRWRIGGREVKNVVEGLIGRIWKGIKGVELDKQFPVMRYADAMATYGSDKPDVRFDLEVGAV